MRKQVGLAVAAVLVVATAGAGCAGNRYTSYDRSEVADQAMVQPLATEGTFAEVGSDDEWVFVPADPGLDDASLTVNESTVFIVGGQTASREAVQEGVPVRVTWDPQTSEILRVEVQEAGGEQAEPAPWPGGVPGEAAPPAE